MRMILPLCVVVVFLSAAALGQQDDVFQPMKGSATPEFEMPMPDGKCLVFGRNIVKTSSGPNTTGEEVRVWHREGTAKGAAACKLRSKPYAEITDSDNGAFSGISANYFFIDEGTSAGSRTLAIYKTGTGDSVTSIEYFGGGDEPRIEAARYLYYDASSNKKGPASSCPEAAKWKRQGGGVAWVQGKKMDLDEQTVSNVGPLRCAYME